MRRILLTSTLLVSLALVALELFARSVMGLGTPPLTIAHPTIEYMFKPNQDVMRFGNRQRYNSFGMRSEELLPGADLVVLALGDSVLNGGNQTDQSELATTLLQTRLDEARHSAYVGNVSAGSWGPGNIRGWLTEHGTLNADLLIFVLSSHDLDDTPEYSALDPSSHPVESPILAISEGARRYLPNYIPSLTFLRHRQVPHPFANPAREDEAYSGTQELSALLAQIRGEKVCLIQHITQSEILNGLHRNHDIIRQAFEDFGAEVVQLDDFIRNSDNPQLAYRDDIHLTAGGQLALFSAMNQCLFETEIIR